MQAVQLLVSFSLCGAVAAQAVCTATVTQTLIASSSTQSTSSQIPPGPLPVGGINMRSPGWSSVSSGIGAQPILAGLPAGGAGWVVGSNLSFGVSWYGSWSAQVAGRLRLHFSSPQPITGMLYCAPLFSASGLAPTGDVSLDVDADGVADHSARTRTPIEVPMTIDSAGSDIDVWLSLAATLSSSSTSTIYGDAQAYWQVLFLPNAYAVESYAPGCTTLGWYRSAQASWMLEAWSVPLPGTQIVAGFFLIGLGEQNVPLTLPPHCPLLVANPSVVVPTTFWPQGMSLTLPFLPIPSGIRFRCQAVHLDTLGNVVTSDAIRTR